MALPMVLLHVRSACVPGKEQASFETELAAPGGIFRITSANAWHAG